MIEVPSGRLNLATVTAGFTQQNTDPGMRFLFAGTTYQELRFIRPYGTGTCCDSPAMNRWATFKRSRWDEILFD